MNIFEGLWSGVSNSVGQGINFASMAYANNTGLTDKLLEAEKQADIRKKEQQKKIIIYSLIGLFLLIILIMITKRK